MQKNYKISHPDNQINCEIDLPSSKSISNRLLIIKALCKEHIRIDNLSKSKDTIYLKNSIINSSTFINVGHGGTTLRFLISFLTIQKRKNVIVSGSERLKQRPIKELIDVLKNMGAKIKYLEKKGSIPIKIYSSTLKGGAVKIKGNISSQFISSLLLIAPTLKNGMKLEISGKIVSKPYILMTLKLMNEFGIKWQWNKNIITIKNQEYKAKKYKVEADWSAASFWFEIAALSKKCKIILKGLNKDSIQGDKEILNIFKRLGVKSIFDQKKLILEKTDMILPLKKINIINTPDLYQPLKCTLTGLNKKVKIYGTSTLKHKESDRLIATEKELVKLKSNKIITTHKDHRIAMSFAPLCLKFGSIQINDIDVVKKSYPEYWKDLKQARFKIKS